MNCLAYTTNIWNGKDKKCLWTVCIFGMDIIISIKRMRTLTDPTHLNINYSFYSQLCLEIDHFKY